jgi:HEAT repeat protein
VEYGILLLDIRDGFRSSDANSVVMLGQAAANSSLRLDFRQSAAHALRGIHTQDALPYLAAVLDDPDIELQSEAVGGLASFANGLAIQTAASGPSLSYLQLPDRAAYKTGETVAHFALGEAAIRYLSYWKTWWSLNRTALGY